jgi:hypothetical protein
VRDLEKTSPSRRSRGGRRGGGQIDLDTSLPLLLLSMQCVEEADKRWIEMGKNRREEDRGRR